MPAFVQAAQARSVKRLPRRRYKVWVAVLMTVYVGVLLVVWPHVKSDASMPVRALLALLPTVPVIAVTVIMAWRVLSGDELEQRLHMDALGIAAAIVCVLSLVGGFLAAAKIATFGGDVLIWVLPVASVTYAIARWLLARRYGGTGCG